MRSIFELFKTDFRDCVRLRISYERTSAVSIGFFASFSFLLLYVLFLALFRDPVYLPPDFDLFIGIYFKELLLPQIIVLGAWYVSTQKTKATRYREYKFLVSLPVTARQIFLKFFLADCIRNLWIPMAFSLLYLGLVPLASIRFLARPIFFVFIFYFFMQSLLICSHFSTILKLNAFRSFNYITKLNPVIIIVSGLFYEIGQLFFLFEAKDLKPLSFILINLTIFASSVLLAWIAQRLFVRLHERNFWINSLETEQQLRKEHRSMKIIDWAYSKIKNPFLFKNLILLFRSKTKLAKNGLTFVFFALAYLLAMNNTIPTDSLAVLFVLTTIYILLYNILALNRLTQNEESSKLLFSLRATKSSLYFSLFIPIGSWLTVAISLLTIWLSLKGFQINVLLPFWLKLCLVIIVTLTTSLNSGLGNYPDIKRGKNRYSLWVFVIIFCSAIFYKFRILIALIISLITFIELRKLKFYQSC